LGRAEDLGKHEVEESPELGKVVLEGERGERRRVSLRALELGEKEKKAHLERSSGQNQSVFRLVVERESLRKLAL